MPSTMLAATTDSDGFNLAPLMGPGWWGYALNLTMFGMSLVQAMNYFRAASKDRLLVKLSAWAMVIMDIASTSLIMSIFWNDLIIHYGGLAQYQEVNPLVASECYISAVIAFLAQVYFMHQIYYVKPPGRLPTFLLYSIAVLAFFGLTFGFGCATVMVLDPSTPHYNLKFQIVFGGSKGANAICDVLATILMCKYLSGSKTGVKSTAELLDALTTIFMNRGAAVMVIQIFTFVMFFAFENPQYWLAPHMLLTKLYVNTFFAILNSRVYLREKYLGGSHIVSSFAFGSPSANSGSTQVGSHGEKVSSPAFHGVSFGTTAEGVVSITRETHVKNDDADDASSI